MNNKDLFEHHRLLLLLFSAITFSKYYKLVTTRLQLSEPAVILTGYGVCRADGPGKNLQLAQGPIPLTK